MLIVLIFDHSGSRKLKSEAKQLGEYNRSEYWRRRRPKLKLPGAEYRLKMKPVSILATKRIIIFIPGGFILFFLSFYPYHSIQNHVDQQFIFQSVINFFIKS